MLNETELENTFESILNNASIGNFAVSGEALDYS
jgi:hypothetical protein